LKSISVADRFDVPLSSRTSEQLTRTADLVLRVANHFIELGDPADGAGQANMAVNSDVTGMPMAR
jgi:hypothetical protein